MGIDFFVSFRVILKVYSVETQKRSCKNNELMNHCLTSFELRVKRTSVTASEMTKKINLTDLKVTKSETPKVINISFRRSCIEDFEVPHHALSL